MSNRWVYGALLAVVGLAAFLRVYLLDLLPATLYYDEAQNGVDALRVIAGERPVFFPANNGREPLMMYLQALAISVLGTTPLALRAPAALAGLLTVVAIFLVGRQLHGPRVGLFAAAWLAISYWHLSLSRLGFRAVLLPLAELACLWLTVRAMRSGRVTTAALAGVALGLTLYTYGSARLFPLALLVGVAALCWGNHATWGLTPHRVARTMAILLVAAFLTALPLGLYFVRHPEFVLERARQVVVTGEAPVPASAVRPPPTPLWENAIATVGMFGLGGDENLRHNLPGRPVFDLPTFGLFLLGVGASLQRKTRWIGALYLPWLLILLVPGAVTVEAPHFLRTIGALPPAFLLLALGADRVLARVAPDRPQLAAIGLALLFAYGVADTARAYFGTFANHPERPAYFDAHHAAAVARADLLGARAFVVYQVSPEPYPSFRYFLPPDRQPAAVWTSLGPALAAARAGDASVYLEHFCCSKDGRPVTLVASHHPVPTATFDYSLAGDAIELIGYTREPPDGAGLPGQATPLPDDTDQERFWLHWRARDAIAHPYRAALLVLDADDRPVAIVEEPIGGRVWPTTSWRPGERYTTLVELRLLGHLAAADAELRLAVELSTVPVDLTRSPVVERVDLGPFRPFGR